MNNPLYNLGLQHGLEKGLAQGLEQGIERGVERGLEQGREQEARLAIADICELLGLELTPARRGHLERLDLRGLEALRAYLKSQRMWPDSSGPAT